MEKDTGPEIELPPEIHVVSLFHFIAATDIECVPKTRSKRCLMSALGSYHTLHIDPDACSSSWLFPQVDAALHHGGAGTTGASLRGSWPFLLAVRLFKEEYSWHSDIN